jgi:hypothetical protein
MTANILTTTAGRRRPGRSLEKSPPRWRDVARPPRSRPPSWCGRNDVATLLLLGTGGVLGFLRGREVASCFEFWRERVMRWGAVITAVFRGSPWPSSFLFIMTRPGLARALRLANDDEAQADDSPGVFWQALLISNSASVPQKRFRSYKYATSIFIWWTCLSDAATEM